MAAEIEDVTAIEYNDLPGFPRPGIEGYDGQLVLGRLGGVDAPSS